MYRSTLCLLGLAAILAAWQKPSPFPEKQRQKKAEAAASAPPAAIRKAARAEKPAGPAGPASGTASFCGTERDGRPTASGELFDSKALTAAHASYPMGSRVKVTNLGNGKSVVVRINDRFRPGRNVILLTRKAAGELDFIAAGYAQVKLEPVNEQSKQ